MEHFNNNLELENQGIHFQPFLSDYPTHELLQLI